MTAPRAWTSPDNRFAQDLKSVWGSSADDVWIVGRGGSILHWKAWATKHFFRYVVDILELPVRNASSGLLVPELGTKIPKFLSIEQAEQLMILPLKGSPTPDILQVRDAAILEVLYGAGLRSAELRGLNVDSLLMNTPEKGDISIRVDGKGNPLYSAYFAVKRDAGIDLRIVLLDSNG